MTVIERLNAVAAHLLYEAKGNGTPSTARAMMRAVDEIRLAVAQLRTAAEREQRGRHTCASS
jgi:hypothetical protein